MVPAPLFRVERPTFICVGSLLFALSGVLGCLAGDTDLPHPAAGGANLPCPTGDDDAGCPDDADAGEVECEAGESRPCEVVIGEHLGVTTCFKGKERCIDGSWGACGE